MNESVWMVLCARFQAECARVSGVEGVRQRMRSAGEVVRWCGGIGGSDSTVGEWRMKRGTGHQSPPHHWSHQQTIQGLRHCYTVNHKSETKVDGLEHVSTSTPHHTTTTFKASFTFLPHQELKGETNSSQYTSSMMKQKRCHLTRHPRH
jgi:hypothetical protein